jgi:diguanylate cyclase (GGDEF)-like protein
MDTLQIVAISSKSGFPKLIRESLQSSRHNRQSLPPFQVDHLSSLKKEIPENLKLSTHVVLVDFESLNGDWEDGIKMVQKNFPGRVLVLVSEGDLLDKHPAFQIENPIYYINKNDLSSPLFNSFLLTLITQSELIQSNHIVRDKLNNRENELLSFRKASLHLTLNLSLDAVLEAILESALDLVIADDTHIFLYEHGVLSFGAALFDGSRQNKPIMKPRPHGSTYQVAREGVMLVINDIMSDPLFEDRRWEGAIISLPLKIGNKVLGVMNVALRRPHNFTENEIQALKFLGDQASIAIQNANLYEQAQQEISDRKKAEKAIQHLANHDSLTGLPNRRLFNERINLEISRAQRNNQKIGIMLFDLDQLKKVNDSYGHNVGDLLLQAVAQRLLGLLRKSDTVARMGGDEFLLILPEMKQPEDAIQTAERILSALSTPFHLDSHEVLITTSIGIVFFPDDGENVDSLIKKADISMYNAKEKGGNVYHVYTE